MKLLYQEESKTRISYFKQVSFFVIIFTAFHILLLFPPLSQTPQNLLTGIYGLFTYTVLLKIGTYSYLSFGSWSQKPKRFSYLYVSLLISLIIGGLAGLVSFQLIELVAFGIISSFSIYIGINIGRATTFNKELDAEKNQSKAYTSKISDAFLSCDLSIIQLTLNEFKRNLKTIQNYNWSIFLSDVYSFILFVISIFCLVPLIGIWGAIGISGAITYASNVMYIEYTKNGFIENQEIDIQIVEIY